MTTAEALLGVTDDDDAFFQLNPKDAADVRRLSVRKGTKFSILLLNILNWAVVFVWSTEIR